MMTQAMKIKHKVHQGCRRELSKQQATLGKNSFCRLNLLIQTQTTDYAPFSTLWNFTLCQYIHTFFWEFKERFLVALKKVELSLQEAHRLRSNTAEEAAKDAGQVKPEEAGKAAEATAVRAAIEVTRTMHRGSIQVLIAGMTMKTAAGGELSPIACKKLVRRCALCCCRKEISTCSLLHKTVLDWRSCSTWPVGIIFLLFSVSCQAFSSLSLDGTDGPACWHQVPQASVREVAVVLIVSLNDRELCIYTMNFLGY
jgi:hypothetical protein